MKGKKHIKAYKGTENGKCFNLSRWIKVMWNWFSLENGLWTELNDKLWEIGKIYELSEKKFKLHKIGFHFCENLMDIDNYCDFSANSTIIYEVEILGNIIKNFNLPIISRRH